ncbi:MAG: gliding motility-associated-like protein [Saprospiraceae bacterium]|jgi:gliding motility-associated-like protein
MRICFFLSLFSLLVSTQLSAQNDCCNADVIDNGNPITIASSEGNGTLETLSSCSCLNGNEHDSHWFVFEAVTSGTFEMMITPTGLTADFDFALFGNECPCGGGTTVSSCDYTGPITTGPFVPTGISSTPMATFGVPGATEWRPTVNITAGTTYYIVADNITDNGAGFTIEFAGTATIGPPPNVNDIPLGPISGTTATCPGANESYSVIPLPGINEYTWTLDGQPANVTVEGDPSITIDWPLEGTYELCVSGQAGCVTTDEVCITVDVSPIPQGSFNDSACSGDPYLASDGNTYSAPGTYNMVFLSYQGCDSIVVLDLAVNLQSLNDIEVQICPGECYTLNGVDYCQEGSWEVVYSGANFQGCDSTDFLNVTVPNYFADYVPNPAPIIDCNSDFAVVDGSPSNVGNNPMYEWTDSDGNVVSSTSTLQAFDGGDYTLTVLSELDGNICSVSTTLTIEEYSDLPNASADGGDIDCNNSSVTLMGNSTTSGAFYSWTGPNGFTSNDQNPDATEIGTYTLTVSTGNGCSSEAMAEITGDTTNPDISAAGGDLDCTNTMVALSGNSSTSGVTYMWSGPNGFTSIEQNPDVNGEGNYTLVVTAINGCTAEASAEVFGDTTEPDVTAMGAILDCSGNEVTLTGNSNTANVNYSWFGPGGFNSNDQNPDASEVGTYTLIVTSQNGCTAEEMVEVASDMDLPEAFATGGGVDCLNVDVVLDGSSGTANVTYEWSGPNGFTSMSQTPTVSDEGDYVLAVLGTNGCTATATAVVTSDSTSPDISVSGTDIDCTTPTSTLSGNSMVAGVTYAWTGPSGFASADQFPVVSDQGDYVLTITASNGCTASDMITVMADQDVPDVSVVGGAINCNNTMVALNGNSNTPDVTYSWTGPNGFTSIDASPTVSEMGDYILVVTSLNGCTSEEMAQVSSDFATPDISTAGGTINCTNMMIALTGNSNTPDVNYAWTGPNGFTSNDASPMVSEMGNYDLIITGINGCTSMESVMVDADTAIPDVSAVGGMIDCDNTTLALQGNSMTMGVTYAWIGPNGFIANEANPITSTGGDYTLTVTAANGCTAASMASVMQNADIPDISATGGTIDCTFPMIGLTSTSSEPTVTYSWTGPNGFTSLDQNPDVVTPGDYTILVTADNGCTAEAIAMVAEDIAMPDVSATGAILTCTITSVMISGSSNTANINYGWSGPGGYTSTDQNPNVTESGDYTLTVTGMNGCTAAATIEVEQDADLPEAIAVGATIDCNTAQVQIEGSSMSPNVTYAWTGPNGFTSNDLMPTVTDPGQYVLTVTSPSDCSSTATALVEDDTNAPIVDVPATTLTCQTPQITLQTMTMDSIVTYSWTGPNGFVSADANPTVSEGGMYDVVIMGANGCDNTLQFSVDSDMDMPDISTIGGTLTCTDPTISLAGSSTNMNVDYSWTGPNGFTSMDANPEVTEQGDYTLILTADNGCTISEMAVVNEDTAAPDIQAIGGDIDCATTMINLEGTSTQGLEFSWDGPNSFLSMQANPQVSEGGDYTLTVTAANGCTSALIATVNEDVAQPDIAATGGELTCFENEINIEGSSATPNVTYAWTGPNSFTSADQMPLINEAGDYTLIVTGENSCTNSQQITVDSDTGLPDVSAVGGILDCADSNVGLAGSSNTPNVTYSWEGPGGVVYTEQNPQVTVAGDYTLTVLSANGCTATAMAIVDQDADIPEVSAIGGTIDCNFSEINIEGSSQTTGVTFAWTGPNGFTSVNEMPLINEAGDYSVIATAVNGCTAEAIAVVEADLATPDAMGTGGIITCTDPSATLMASSNTAGATYLWIGQGGFTSDEQDVDVTEAGNYGLIVTAPNGCTTVINNVMITQDADVPVASVADETIDCITTEVELMVTANQTDITYEWTGPNGFNSNIENPIVSAPGIYTLVITSMNDCSATASALVIENLDSPNIEIAVADEFNCTTDEVSLDANNSASGSDFTITWTTADGSIITGGNTLSPTVDESGVYVLEILNTTNGCSSTETVTVIESIDIPSNAAILEINPTCFGDTDGQIVIESVEGGTPPYSYSLNGGDFGSSAQFNFLEGGNYDLVIQDGVGCEYEDNLTLENPDELVVNLTVSGTNAENQLALGDGVELDAQVVGASEFDLANVTWNTLEGFVNDCDSCLNQQVLPIFSTNYTITIVDENGCTATDDIQLIVDRQRPVFVPNIFSPNNDGTNDVAMIYGGASVAKVKSFLIFNRWGEQIFQVYDFPPNEIDFGWNGLYRGEVLDAAVFVYYAEVEFIDGETEIFKGDISLIR